MEAIPVIERADAYQSVTLDVVEFNPGSQVAVIGYKAAGANCEVRSVVERSGCAGGRGGEIHVLPIGGSAHVNEQLTIAHQRLFILLAERSAMTVSANDPPSS